MMLVASAMSNGVLYFCYLADRAALTAQAWQVAA